MAKVGEPIELKIKKLIELANKTINEEESSSFMEKAHELLAKYNLEIADVNAVNDPSKIESAEEAKRVKEKHTRGAMYEYQQRLWATLSTVNFCWHWTVPVYKSVNGVHRIVTRHHYIVGRESNVTVTKMMGDYLEATINRLCPYQGTMCLSRSAISWKEGCSERIRARLYERYSEEMASAAPEAGAAEGAMTLRRVHDAESDANYCFLYGEEAFKDMLRERQQCAQQRAQRIAAHIVDSKPEKPETHAQRTKRLAREERDRERAERRNDKYWARRDVSAWYAGRKAGDEVGLEPQVDKGGRSQRPALSGGSQ